MVYFSTENDLVASESSEAEMKIDSPATLEILAHPNYKDWPNFDIVQPQKLEWMNDISAALPPLKPGETFEAR